MGRKQNRSSLVRIQKATRAHQRKFTTTLQDIARQSEPGEWQTEIIEHPPSVPCGEEYNALQEILTTTSGVFWKPRKRKEYRVDSSNLKKWQLFAENYIDWVGYSEANGLSHHTQDLDFLFQDDKENYND